MFQKALRHPLTNLCCISYIKKFFYISRPTTRSTMLGVSAIDSVNLCFEQLTSMNVNTLQQLCANFLQSRKSVSAPLEGAAASPLSWGDISLDKESEPTYSSNKCVIYSAHWKSNPSSQPISVMVSHADSCSMSLVDTSENQYHTPAHGPTV